MRRLWVALAALTLLAGFPASVLAGTAAAAPRAPATPSVSIVTDSCWFFSKATPGSYTCRVPDGVTSLNFEVRAANGGRGFPGSSGTPTSAGQGATISGSVPVAAGETLYVTVGSTGAGYDGIYNNGGGGGYTSVAHMVAGTLTPLVVAGGGGGAGAPDEYTGPNAGGAGGNGGTTDTTRGGGAGGASAGSSAAAAGQAGGTLSTGGAGAGIYGGAGGDVGVTGTWPSTAAWDAGAYRPGAGGGGFGAYGGFANPNHWVPAGSSRSSGFGAGGEGSYDGGGGGGGGYAGGGGGGANATLYYSAGGGGGGSSLVPEGATASIVTTTSPHAWLRPTGTATLYVVPFDHSVTFGDAAPGSGFYTFHLTDGVSEVATAGIPSYAAPTCGSDYTTTTSSMASPLEITCGGHPNGNAGSATGVTFDYGATALLTIDPLPSTCTTVTGNLVANCGFESTFYSGGTQFTSWTPSANWTVMYANSEFPHGGIYAVQAGPMGTPTTMSQVLATTAGATYELRFYLKGGGAYNAAFTAAIDGTTVVSHVNTTFAAYHLDSSVFQASSASTTLVFSFLNQPDFWYLDDVSVAPTADSTPPTLTLAQKAGQADPTKTSPVNFSLVADEALDASTVTAADFSATNGTVGTVACTGTPTTCTIPVTPTADGAVTIAPSGSFSVADVSGNAQTTAGGTDRSVTYDTVAPTLTLAQKADQADPTKTSPVNFSLVADEALDTSTVTAIDFSVTNGTIGSISCTGTPSSCTIPVTPTASGTVTIAPAGLSAPGVLFVAPVGLSVADLAGNLQTTAGGTDRVVTYDATAPTLTLEQATGQADPTNAGPINFNLVADEALDTSTVAAADFSATNGSIGTPLCSGAPTTCTIPVTPTADGAVTLNPSGTFSVADLLGNARTTAGGVDRSVTYDTSAPTVTLEQKAGQGDPTNTSPVNFSLVANEVLDSDTVTGTDFTVTNGTLGTIVCAGAPTTCTIPVTPTGAGEVTIAPASLSAPGVLGSLPAEFSVADIAGNVQTTAGGTDRSITYDSTAPTLTLEQAVTQADPTSTGPVSFSLVADEALDLTTITAADFTITNGTIGTLDCSGTPTTCTIPVTPTAAGEVTIAPSGAFSIADLAGNLQTTAGGTDRSVTYDTTAPTLTLEQAAGQADPTDTSPVSFSLVADEALDLSTITSDDFSATNGTIGTIDCSGDPTTCTISVTPTAYGTVTIGPSGTFSVADVAANAQTTAGGTDRSVTYQATGDTTAPTLTLAQAAGQADPAKTTPVNFSLVADEALDTSTVTAADFVIMRGRIGTIDCSGTPTTCTIPVTPTRAGDVTIAPSAGFSAADLAGNAQTVAGGTDRRVTYDPIVPTLTLAQKADQADPANTGPVNFSLVANEALDPTTVTAEDFTATNGTIGTITCTGTPTTCTIPVTPTSDGIVTIDVAAGFSASDLAGNAQTIAVGTDRSVSYHVGPIITASAKVQGSKATITWTTTGAVSTTCSLDGAPVTCIDGQWVGLSLPVGTHSFVINATDGLGNPSTMTVEFTIKSGKVKL